MINLGTCIANFEPTVFFMEFYEYRIRLDEALTYNNLRQAKVIATLAYLKARRVECLSERLYFKAQLAIIDEDYIEAIELLEKTIQHNPHDGAAFNDLALCLVELGLLKESLFYFDRGIKAEPDYANIYHNKGWLLAHLGHYTEAMALYHKALFLEPHRAVTYENLGHILEGLGRKEEAVSAYRKAVGLLKSEHGTIRRQIQDRIQEILCN